MLGTDAAPELSNVVAVLNAVQEVRERAWCGTNVSNGRVAMSATGACAARARRRSIPGAAAATRTESVDVGSLRRCVKPCQGILSESFKPLVALMWGQSPTSSGLGVLS